MTTTRPRSLSELATPELPLWHPCPAPVLATLYTGHRDVDTLDAQVQRLRGAPGVPGDARVLAAAHDCALLIGHIADRIVPGQFLVYDGGRLSIADGATFRYQPAQVQQ